MMKSFFKKLAFVMALAMVVTMAAPAAAKAYAADMYLAYQTGGKVTELNMKVGSEEDLCFKKAPTNWASLTKKWSSDNEAVAIVDKNGVVTAIADGVAVITFTLGDGTAASATVNVGEVKPYDVTLGNKDDKAMTALELKVGTAFDLNFYGVKDWAASKYSVTWVSNAPEVAKVDQKGNVAAVAAGSATVTAAIVNNTTGVVMNVTPVVVTVPTEVVVPAFTAKQTAADTVVVTFAEDQTYTYEDFTVTEIFEDITVDAPIKAAEFTNGTGTTVTLKMSAKFDDGEKYEVAFKDTKAEFVASVGAVTDVEFIYKTVADKCDEQWNVAYIETEDENNTVVLVPQFFDAKGINVTSVVKEENFSIEYAPVVDSEKYTVGYEEVTFESTGVASIKMNATWFNEEDEECADEWIGEIVATKRPNLKVSYTDGAVFYEKSDKLATMTWEGEGTYTHDFKTQAWGYLWSNGKGTTTVYLEDNTVPVFVARISDNRDFDVLTTDVFNVEGNDHSYKGDITYDTSNENIFEIDPATGEITPKKVGSAAVLVYFTEIDSETPVLVGSTKVTVKAPRYPATISINMNQARFANAGLDVDSKFEITVKDQYGSKIDLANDEADLTVEANSSTKNSPILSINREGTGKYTIYVNEDMFVDMDADTTSDSHSYSITVDKEENPKLDKSKLTFSVRIYNVTEAMAKMADKSDLKYAVKYNGNYYGGSVDVKVNNNTIDFGNPSGNIKKDIKSQELGVYYVDKNGFRLKTVDNLVALGKNQKTGVKGTVYYEVSEPAEKPVTNPENDVVYVVAATGGSFTWKFNTDSATTQAFSAYATEGNYKVTFHTTKSADNNLKKLGDYTVSVTNSQPDLKYTGYTWDYATRDNSHYCNFDAIEATVKTMSDRYHERFVDMDAFNDFLADKENNTLDPMVKAIYECLGFEYLPEVNNWAYSEVHNGGTLTGTWYTADKDALLYSYEVKKVSDTKVAIKSVTFQIQLPGSDAVVYQTVKVNASISK